VTRLARALERARLAVRDVRLDWQLDEIAGRERSQLAAARRAAPVSSRDPLVSVTIPTYNRGELLVKRTLPSVFAQTYRNFEVVIVGDCCPDDTPQRIAALGDPRVRFVNLPQRGNYPADPKKRWMVAGSVPINETLRLARGEWISYLDDDDVYTPDHIEKLLRAAQERDLELVFGRYRYEKEPGRWLDGRTREFPTGRPPYRRAGIPHSGVLYRSYLRFFDYYVDAWRYGLPTDNLLWQRMGRAGVRAGFLDELVCIVPLRPGESAMSIDAVEFAR
jgi:glycosyltransferase involved in cell wall biosynthesis